MPGPDAKIRNYIFAPMMTNVRRPVYIDDPRIPSLLRRQKYHGDIHHGSQMEKPRVALTVMARPTIEGFVFDSSVNFVFIVEIRIFIKNIRIWWKGGGGGVNFEYFGLFDNNYFVRSNFIKIRYHRNFVELVLYYYCYYY